MTEHLHELDEKRKRRQLPPGTLPEVIIICGARYRFRSLDFAIKLPAFISGPVTVVYEPEPEDAR